MTTFETRSLFKFMSGREKNRGVPKGWFLVGAIVVSVAIWVGLGYLVLSII